MLESNVLKMLFFLSLLHSLLQNLNSSLLSQNSLSTWRLFIPEQHISLRFSLDSFFLVWRQFSLIENKAITMIFDLKSSAKTSTKNCIRPKNHNFYLAFLFFICCCWVGRLKSRRLCFVGWGMEGACQFLCVLVSFKIWKALE